MTVYNLKQLLSGKIYTESTISVLSLRLFALLNSENIVDWRQHETGKVLPKAYFIGLGIQYYNNEFDLYLGDIEDFPSLGILITRVVPRGLNLDSASQLIFVILEEIHQINSKLPT